MRKRNLYWSRCEYLATMNLWAEIIWKTKTGCRILSYHHFWVTKPPFWKKPWRCFRLSFHFIYLNLKRWCANEATATLNFVRKNRWSAIKYLGSSRWSSLFFSYFSVFHLNHFEWFLSHPHVLCFLFKFEWIFYCFSLLLKTAGKTPYPRKCCHKTFV